MKKNYKQWMKVKSTINNGDFRPIGYKERDVRLCNLGENIGFEEDGKGDKYLRPVLVLKAYSRLTCYIVPLSTTSKEDKYHYKFDAGTGKVSNALLSQTRTIDSSRLTRKIGVASEVDFNEIKRLVSGLNNLDIVHPSSCDEGRHPEGICNISIANQSSKVNSDFKDKTFEPSKEILKKYADVLVNFALGSGKGIKKGDVVRVVGSEAGRSLYIEVMKAIWDAGGHTIGDYYMDTYSDDDNLDRYFYENATDAQIDHFNRDYSKGMIKQIDHQVIILADTNPQSLKGVDANKIMRRGLASKPASDWLDKKENEGKFTWTLGLYGTEAMAKEAGLTLEEYWEQIIKACYLDKKDPIAEWKKTTKQIDEYSKKLDKLSIEWVHVKGKDMDLKIKLGKERKWKSGSGCNIPSFEIFTSPDWRGTSGWAKFNQPLYRYGNIIEGIELWFEDGKVVESKATKNQKVLREMIATEGADKLGEFSLTDARFSRITKFMAETLYDENVGGKYGNTHVALGKSFPDCYKGDVAKVTKKQWKDMGYNDSSVHTDIVSTANRKVTATLQDGTKKVIYENGRFSL